MKIDDSRLAVAKQLVDSREKKWSVSELADQASVSQSTVSRIIPEFEEEGIVSSSRKGNMKMIELERDDYLENVVRAVSDKNSHLREASEKFASKISGIEKVEKILLFGSVARGTADFHSDIDMLVLVPEKSEKLSKTIMIKAEKVSEETGFHVSPTVMETGVWKEHESENSQFYRSISDEMVELYGK